MRLLLAARLSQDRAGQTGLDTQDTDARAWAERNGHDVIATAADKISGRTSPFDRPNLGPWLTEPHLVTQYDGIVVSETGQTLPWPRLGHPRVGRGEPQEDRRGQPGAVLAAREG